MNEFSNFFYFYLIIFNFLLAPKSGQPTSRAVPGPKTISNKDQVERCGTESMATILMRRRWRCIGHVPRQEASVAKTALHWTPERKRRRGRPKCTAADSGGRNATDGKDLEQHFSHGERPAEVEGSRCCPTRHPE